MVALGVGSAAWRQAGPVAPPPALPEKLVLGVADALLAIPVFVAEEQGFLRDAGLDVTTRHFSAGKLALEALFRGEVEDSVVDLELVVDAPRDAGLNVAVRQVRGPSRQLGQAEPFNLDFAAAPEADAAATLPSAPEGT
jgi:ABC-type nitrate/sulfonate/bicarbonate transport system substrate-binding protein